MLISKSQTLMKGNFQLLEMFLRIAVMRVEMVMRIVTKELGGENRRLHEEAFRKSRRER